MHRGQIQTSHKYNKDRHATNNLPVSVSSEIRLYCKCQTKI